MTKHKMAKTRIHLALGDHVDVQEKYGMVEELLTTPSERWVHLTLENGDPVSFQRNWIAYITKR